MRRAARDLVAQATSTIGSAPLTELVTLPLVPLH